MREKKQKEQDKVKGNKSMTWENTYKGSIDKVQGNRNRKRENRNKGSRTRFKEIETEHGRIYIKEVRQGSSKQKQDMRKQK